MTKDEESNIIDYMNQNEEVILNDKLKWLTSACVFVLLCYLDGEEV